jgi:serine/threonine-protein kinase RsbW
VLSGVQFSVDDLREVRRVTAQWAARAGLPVQRADDFVIAVNEIATNAVRYGSPQARLELRVVGGCAVEAEVGDDGCWLPGPRTPAGHERGGMGIPVARRLCDAVDIQAGADGTTVILRMSRPGPEDAAR